MNASMVLDLTINSTIDLLFTMKNTAKKGL